MVVASKAEPQTKAIRRVFLRRVGRNGPIQGLETILQLRVYIIYNSDIDKGKRAELFGRRAKNPY
jgi:hypothetical protein